LNSHSKRYLSAELSERKFSVDAPIVNKLQRWFDVSGECRSVQPNNGIRFNQTLQVEEMQREDMQHTSQRRCDVTRFNL
jgi:hypothetical protein